MPELLFFEWTKSEAGYRLVDDEKKYPPVFTSLIGAGPFLYQIGDKWTKYRPLEDNPALFRELAATEKTPTAVKSFADRYGFLGANAGDSKVSAWYPSIDALREAVFLWGRGELNAVADRFNHSYFADTSFRLVRPHGEDRLSLRITPTSLWSALWLQFAQTVSTIGNPNRLRQCKWCPRWFVFGTGTGKRKSGHYCSPRCQKAAWKHQNEKKTNGLGNR